MIDKKFSAFPFVLSNLLVQSYVNFEYPEADGSSAGIYICDLKPNGISKSDSSIWKKWAFNILDPERKHTQVWRKLNLFTKIN